MQSEALSCVETLNPSFSRDFPAAQSSHAVEPTDSTYFPAPQMTQESAETPMSAVNFPSGQSVQDAAPASLHWPARQFEQSKILLCNEISTESSWMNFPLMQSRHSVEPEVSV